MYFINEFIVKFDVKLFKLFPKLLLLALNRILILNKNKQYSVKV